jgi:hypothetical protein
MTQQFNNITFDEGATTPSSFPRTPSPSTGHLSARSSLEAISPMDPASVKPADDEQIVNIALISFLHTLTIFHKDVRASWAINRKVFNFSDKFQARTDGLLRSGRNEYPLAILEVKSHVRMNPTLSRFKCKNQHRWHLGYITIHIRVTSLGLQREK